MKTFTLAELKVFWADYDTKKCMRLLKNGAWEVVPLDGRSQKSINATRAEIVPLKKTKTFPEYLESL